MTFKFPGARCELTVLIFDQFEEFFFVYPDQSQRLAFYEFLRVCLDIPFLKVILSLREDYLHYLLELDRLFDLSVINNNILDKNIRYYLGNFSPADAKAVVQSLTERSHFYLESGLIDQLIQDLAAEFKEVRPIELQIIGAQLQTEKITTLKKYINLSENPKLKLVEKSLEAVIADCGYENKDAAWKILYALTDEKSIRPLRTKDDLVSVSGESPKEVDFILKILVGSGLVFIIHETPSNRYQLIHDYLINPIRNYNKNSNLFISLLKHTHSIPVEIKTCELTSGKVVFGKAYIKLTNDKTFVPIRILREINAKPIGKKQYINGVATKTVQPYFVSIRPEGSSKFYDIEVFDWEGQILNLGKDFIQKIIDIK